jgi:hypothetical protein
MIAFKYIRNDVPSRSRHYLALIAMWLYVLIWFALVYFVIVWDMSTILRYTLDFVLIMLAPWPLTGLFQSYGSFVKEYKYQEALSGLDSPLMLEDYDDVLEYGKRGEIIFMSSGEELLQNRHDVLGYSRHIGYDSQGRKFSIECAEQEVSSIDISDEIASVEAKDKAIDHICYMMGGSQIQETAAKMKVTADRGYLECLSLKGIYEIGLKLGI